ncbi:MAG: MerR family DNA-binding transcriptional regulator [Alphaproteobacteria bacterium]
MTQTTYTIRQLAKEFSLTARAIRFYEDKGLIAPTRIGQNRLFSHRDKVRLSLVVRGKRVGFSLAEIKEMLDLYDLAGPRAQLAVSVGKFRKRIAELEAQRDEIEHAIEDLRASANAAEEFLAKSSDAQAPLIGYGLKSDNPAQSGD